MGGAQIPLFSMLFGKLTKEEVKVISAGSTA
jgi:hypothetical protein